MRHILLWQTLCAAFMVRMLLIATANSFTGNVLESRLYEKKWQAHDHAKWSFAYKCKMSGAELKKTVRNFVEGYPGGFLPFNRGSLPVVQWDFCGDQGETEDGYTVRKVTKDGKSVQDNDRFTVTCLAIPRHMEADPAGKNIVFDSEDISVKDTWTGHISEMVMLFLQSLKTTLL